VILPVLLPDAKKQIKKKRKKKLADLSISISTTSPSTISVSSLILTPIDLLNA